MTTTKRKKATASRNPERETAVALKALIVDVEAALDLFNKNMAVKFGEGFIDLPGEFRSQVERIDGALSAARDYLESVAGGIRDW